MMNMERHVEYALLNLPVESSHSQLDIPSRSEVSDQEPRNKSQCNIWYPKITIVLFILIIILGCTVGILVHQLYYKDEKSGKERNCEEEIKNNCSYVAMRDQLCIKVPNTTMNQENECRICPVDWKLFQENCYYISSNNQHKRWNESQAFCEGMKSHLLVIENQEQMIFLNKIIDENSSHWIGLYYNDSIMNWTWVNCESCKDFQLTFKNTSEVNQCVLRATTYYSEKCHSPNSWICQRKAIRL
ncbi:natural killer cells antigen CD94-like [Engystomops pustulosus]|uniref:natural killer cells antigen CD94-like n=1 Tax=Engystomops pustulosus TaxID=76066 RepID=UPI003AFAD61C